MTITNICASFPVSVISAHRTVLAIAEDGICPYVLVAEEGISASTQAFMPAMKPFDCCPFWVFWYVQYQALQYKNCKYIIVFLPDVCLFLKSMSFCILCNL